MQSEEEIPLCPSCNHRHIEGFKCDICGHVGRSQVYPKMRARAAARRQFSTQIFNGEVSGAFPELWRIMLDVRQGSFGEPGSEDSLEGCSSHSLTRVGDALVGYTRFRLLSSMPSGSLLVIVDRMHVLPPYQRQGCGRKICQQIEEQVRQSLTNKQAGVFVLAVVPDYSPVTGWLPLAGAQLASTVLPLMGPCSQWSRLGEGYTAFVLPVRVREEGEEEVEVVNVVEMMPEHG